MIIIVMGVSGCGKSTVATLLAKQLGISYIEADDLHPVENKNKMSSGIPLNDADRIPWLKDIRNAARDFANSEQSCVIACSALKRAYREILNEAGQVTYVYLEGEKAVIQNRIKVRSGHFMPESLLDSQFEALEPPTNEASVVTVRIDSSPENIVSETVDKLRETNII